MPFKLFIQNNASLDPLTLIGTYTTEKKALEAISDDLSKRDLKIHYIRQWVDEQGILWIDYGSHTTFYLIKKVAKETEKSVSSTDGQDQQ